MPNPNDQPAEYRWWPTTCYPNSTPVASYMLYRVRTGWRWKAGESKHQVLPVDRTIGFGSVVRNPTVPKAVPPYNCSGSPEMTDWRNGGNVTQVPAWCRAANNQAYARFREKALGENASMGVATLEARESFGMIANRAIQLRKAYKHIRKGELLDALHLFGIDKPKRKHRTPSFRRELRRRTHDASALWLEYWFGWAPFVADMFSAVEVLTQPLPSTRVRGSASCSRTRNWTRSSGTTGRYRFDSKFRATYRTGATLQVDNLNLFMANQLGLINPASIAWEAVPFSFVVDWFSGVGNVLDSWTDFVGVRVTDPYNTKFAREVWEQQLGDIDQFANGLQTTLTARSYMLVRKKGLLQPFVTVPRFLNVGSSKTRAASAVSLLTQALTGK